MIASVVEVIRQERTAGSSDDEIARLLRDSKIPPPEGHHHWQRVAVRETAGENAGGTKR